MLDVARNFQPKAQVFRVLDLMSRYKLNVLHFHLTEDESWRVEMPSLPELTAVGARRGHTLDSSRLLPPAFGSGGDVANPYGSGFYSRADYGDILRYAAARHIQVIPEIEMPGHARAAIKSMEARARALREKGDAAGAGQYLLSDPDDKSVYTSAQGYHDNVMNPALPSTYAFVERVVADLAALHQEAGVPLRNLHLGGDEVPGGVWERSPAVAAYMKEHGLASVDELWYVFYGRVEQIVKAHGLVPSGWEELGLRTTRLDGRKKLIPNPDFASRGWTAYVWNNSVGGGAEDLAYRMANAGYKVVLCPVSNNYLDMAWNKNPEERGLDWGGYVGLEKPFAFIPFDYYRNTHYDYRGNPVDPAVFVGKDRLTDYGRSNIVGLQGALWSETLGADGRLDYMLVPKLYGLAERAWAPEPEWARERDRAKSDALFRDAYSAFANVVGKRELPRLDRESPVWSYRIPKPGLKVEGGQVRASLEIPGFVLRYTTDGTEPTAKSPSCGERSPPRRSCGSRPSTRTAGRGGRRSSRRPDEARTPGPPCGSSPGAVMERDRRDRRRARRRAGVGRAPHGRLGPVDHPRPRARRVPEGVHAPGPRAVRRAEGRRARRLRPRAPARRRRLALPRIDRGRGGGARPGHRPAPPDVRRGAVPARGPPLLPVRVLLQRASAPPVRAAGLRGGRCPRGLCGRRRVRGPDAQVAASLRRHRPWRP